MVAFHSRLTVLFLVLLGSTVLPQGDAFVLEAIGFGQGGVVAGSLAAAWHSTIGNVAAGSVFATLQSAGTVVAFSSPVTAAVAVGVGAGAAYYASKE